MRFFLLDKIQSFQKGKSVEAVKTWSLSEDFFDEHFPGFPVVPGVLITESMAQALGMLIEYSYLDCFPDQKENIWCVLSLIHKAKFKKFVRPGEPIKILGTLNKIELNSAQGSAEVFVDGNLVSQADFSFTLFPRSVMPSKRLVEQRDEYFKMLTWKEPEK